MQIIISTDVAQHMKITPICNHRRLQPKPTSEYYDVTDAHIKKVRSFWQVFGALWYSVTNGQC